MKNPDQRWVFRWALPASLVLHLFVAALVMFELPVPLSQPQEEEAIKVDLVPPPKPPEKAKPSPPKQEPKSAKSQQAKVETPTSKDAARPSPVVKPVFQFGEKDAGPRQSLGGNSAEDGSASPTAQRDLDKQKRTEPPAAEATDPQAGAPKMPAPEMPVSKMPAPEMPAPKPADAAKKQEPAKLQEAKRLFSQAATGDPVATTAMRNVPRGVRVGRLCLTELREQLLNALPPYFPDVLPTNGLNDSKIIEVRGAAFRASRQWYNLSYRCEVDANATKVVSFAFHVGDPVPRSEWQRRGLPSQ